MGTSDQQASTQSKKRRNPDPLPNEARRQLFRDAIVQLSDKCKAKDSVQNITEWCEAHGFNSHTLRSWRGKSRNISPENLAKLYQATGDNRFLVTEEEKQLLHEKMPSKDGLPAEESWPTINDDGSFANSALNNNHGEDQHVTPTTTIEPVVKYQVEALRALYDLHPEIVFQLLQQAFEGVIQMKKHGFDIHDLFRAIDDLDLYVTQLLNTGQQQEKKQLSDAETTFLGFIYMTSKIIEIRLGIKNEQEEVERVQDCVEKFEQVFQHLRKNEEIHCCPTCLEHFPQIIILLTQTNNIVLEAIDKDKLLDRQKDYGFFAAKDILKVLKSLKNDLPEWFTTWVDNMESISNLTTKG